MMRNLWDRIMIGLMLAVICFCLFDLWSSPARLGCVVGIGGAIVVIFLKINALKQAREAKP